MKASCPTCGIRSECECSVEMEIEHELKDSVFTTLCHAAEVARAASTDEEKDRHGFVLTAAALAGEAWELAGQEENE